MENNDSNLKPQTGGLKLMTVFIGAFALHVVVIGSITAYCLMGSSASDADVAIDKTHKDVKIATDGSLPDPAATPDATAAPAATPAPSATDDAKPVAAAPTPAPDATASTEPAIAPLTTPATLSPTPDSAIVAEVTSATPSGPTPTGPVFTPVQPTATTAPVTPSATPVPSTDMAAADMEATTPAADQEATAGIPYMVKKHDSLARIAHAHHITVAQLRSANALKSDLLQIGQKLTIPAQVAAADTEAVASTGPDAAPADKTPADKPHATTARTEKSQPDRTLLGDSVTLAPSEKKVSGTSHDQTSLVVLSGNHHLYIVAKGDTLSRIAHKFHTTTRALLAANDISDPRKLSIGQKLKVPSSEPRSATNTSPRHVTQPEPVEPRATPVETPSEPAGQMADQSEPTQTQPRSEPTGQLANFMP